MALVNRYLTKKTELISEQLSPLVCQYKIFNRDYTSAADNMLRGVFSFPHFGEVHYPNGINWDEKRFSRSFLLQLHSHVFLVDLINAFQESNNPKYIICALEIIGNWILNNPINKPMNSMSWHDHGTAMRLIIWILLFDVARKVGTENDLVNLLEHIRKHAELLYSDSFYTDKHNHGLFQDISLLVFCTYFAELRISKVYYNRAKERIKNYLDYAINKEGVHLEHSPSYHIAMAQEMGKMKEYFISSNDQFSGYLSSLHNKMSIFGINIIKPDGKLPTIGDTFAKTTPKGETWPNNPYYKYAITNGSRGTMPKVKDIVFPEAGYAIFRNSWALGERGTYILFNAAYHSLSHKHADDLSVFIYSNGDLFIDSGPNGYDYDNPFTKYGYSSFSHNTLIVDDKGLPPYSGESCTKVTRIREHLINKDVCYVSGINTRYNGVKHIRELVYKKRTNVVEITDSIESGSFHNYKFLWHLASDLEPVIDNNKIDIFKNGQQICKVILEPNTICKISFVKGQEEPRVLGWHFLGIQEPIPTKTVIIEIDGSNLEIETIIQLRSCDL